MSKDNPYYLFDTDGFKKNILELNEAYKKYYSNFQIAYSFKTNYLKAACSAVLDNGGMAEVVSPYELEYARKIGFPDNRIVFNGVIPSFENKLAVLKNCGIVNIDSKDEFEEIFNYAEENRIPVKVGLRVNFEVDGAKSRFGIDVDGQDFNDIVLSCRNSNYVSIAGFHNHLHGKRYAKYWKYRAERLIELAKKYGASYIDLGGGMWGKMPPELKKQFKVTPNTYQEYGEIVGKTFKEAFPDESVKLIIEPGIGLVGNVMECVAKVVSFKEVSGKQYVLLNINGAATAFDYCCDDNGIDKPFHIIHHNTEGLVYLNRADICGTTCIEKDILYRDFTGKLAIGDEIVFENIGAYSIVTARQFITPRFGVYDKNSKECLRPAESFDDMFRLYL